MMKHTEMYLIFALFSAGIVAGGCASGKQVSSSQVPNQPLSSNEAKASYTKSQHYVVKPHDCLWRIAGKSSIYGDSFQWPLLYKANRDLITDPDLIYPKQNLKVAEGLPQQQIDLARKLAMSTPKYKAHIKPRETQLTEYF